MRRRILIAEPLDFSSKAVERLQTRADVELRATGPDGLRAAFAEYDVVWFRLAHRIGAALLEPPLKCRIIATAVTGIDHIDLEACARAGVRVVSLKGEVDFLKEVRATAELTLGLALALLRHVPEAAQSVRSGQWRRDLFRGNELYGKTVGLVGVGRLGTIVGRYFAAFGARVLGYDVRADLPPEISRVATLGELLAQSDLVSVHVSLDASTRGMIGRSELAAMKRGSWLINTSRGGVLDEAALLDALAEGRLAGAALDVLSGEPAIDASHPVVRYAATHPNLLVVPHIGGNTFESLEKTEVFLAGRVLEALE
jgi:D-3-phosphoglycerate dehydrogenase / 2-oxoglutarate reductase